jgi:tetratricopeptide (TPR) repeat protein
MHSAVCRCACAALALSAIASAQPPGQDPGDFIKQGQALTRQGKTDDALDLYRHALELTPDSFPANSAAGVAADLKGDYAAARQFFGKAIQTAHSSADRIRALRDMAISYGFEGACPGAVKYGQQAYDLEIAARDYYNAGEVADELARLCIDAGDLDTASPWYKTGHDAGLREPGIAPARVNLWEFRWEHAQARLAARRGDRAAAAKHAAAAQAILAKGDNPQQQQFLPYLTGYLAFYAGDYETAIAAFQKGNLDDAFVVSMIAQAYEKLGARSKAMDHYQVALGFTSHNPPVAYARPLARRKLAP